MELVVNGAPVRLRLTLGALAELEARLEEQSLLALVGRFEAGAFKSRDILELLAAGTLGGGAPMSVAELGSAKIEGGPVAAARAAGRLLKLSFALPETDDE